MATTGMKGNPLTDNQLIQYLVQLFSKHLIHELYHLTTEGIEVLCHFKMLRAYHFFNFIVVVQIK